MRRGQSPRYDGPGFTKKQLLEAASVSPKIFDSIRKAARVSGPPHGGLSWLFPPPDIRTMIAQARKKTQTDRGGQRIAQAWEDLLEGRTPESEPTSDE
jgi:hypothetical protein